VRVVKAGLSVPGQLASCLLRWQGRATPFGLFAGVSAAHAGGDHLDLTKPLRNGAAQFLGRAVPGPAAAAGW
jgi:Lantibiotic dehydratase, N terminus